MAVAIVATLFTSTNNRRSCAGNVLQNVDIFVAASILHLLAIALDRYWAVTRVDYIRCQRNKRRILFMILFVWMTSGVISLAPVLGWKDAQFEWRITNDNECLISQDIGYQVFATCTTFYFPVTLTLIFYWKIYQVSKSLPPPPRVKCAMAASKRSVVLRPQQTGDSVRSVCVSHIVCARHVL